MPTSWTSSLNITPTDSINAKARYKANFHTSCRESNSQLVDHLINAKWIPNKSGEFFSPAQISKDQLRDDFIFDNRNELLTAIGFGSQAERVSEGYLQRQTVAEELGFDSAEELEKWKKIKDFGISPDDIIAQYAQRPRISQPEDSVLNPTRRQEKLLANIADAPSKESVTLERSIQKGISEVTAQAKAYLRVKYKNGDEQLVCQCCHSEMPFKLRSNEYYFEAVQCISDKEMRHFQNRLALCPNCAAMYQYARETKDADIHRCIIEHEADDQASSVEIPVRLAGRELTLRFVVKHWLDLKTILSKWLWPKARNPQFKHWLLSHAACLFSGKHSTVFSRVIIVPLCVWSVAPLVCSCFFQADHIATCWVWLPACRPVYSRPHAFLGVIIRLVGTFQLVGLGVIQDTSR